MSAGPGSVWVAPLKLSGCGGALGSGNGIEGRVATTATGTGVVLQQQYTSQQAAHETKVTSHPPAIIITTTEGRPEIQSITSLGDRETVLESIATAPMPAFKQKVPRFPFSMAMVCVLLPVLTSAWTRVICTS